MSYYYTLPTGDRRYFATDSDAAALSDDEIAALPPVQRVEAWKMRGYARDQILREQFAAEDAERSKAKAPGAAVF